jgi:hypothetical protein
MDFFSFFRQIIEKRRKKFFLRKTGLPVKPEYPENRETSKTFFPDSFLKFNSQQVHVKKINSNCHVSKLNKHIF